MTNVDRSKEERRLDDERCVDGLLAETGLPGHAELRDMLLELRNLRVTDAPEPSAELAALMGRTGTAEVIRLTEWHRKGSGKKRAAFTTLAVAAALGVAGGAAAANESLRSTAEGTISSMVGSLFPSSHPKPAPASPSPAPATEPAQAPPSSPAVVLPSPAGTVPATSVPGVQPPPGDGRQEPQGPKRGPQTPDGSETGRDGAAAGQTGEKPAHSGASRAPEVRPPANERPGNEPPANDRALTVRPSGGGEAPGNRRSDDKARNGVGTQEAGEPKSLGQG